MALKGPPPHCAFGVLGGGYLGQQVDLLAHVVLQIWFFFRWEALAEKAHGERASLRLVPFSSVPHMTGISITDRSYGPPWPAPSSAWAQALKGWNHGPPGFFGNGDRFSCGHSPGGPLPHTECFREPSPNRTLPHAISSHADGPFYCLGYGPQLQIFLWSRCSPIWAHILHSLWHVTLCKMALEAHIGFIWASPGTPLHQATPPTLCSPRTSPRHGLPNWCNFTTLQWPTPHIPTSPRHGLTLGSLTGPLLGVTGPRRICATSLLSVLSRLLCSRPLTGAAFPLGLGLAGSLLVVRFNHRCSS